MQKIKVTDIQSKPTKSGGTFYTLTDEHNTRYGGFISELSEVRKGDVINVDIQVKGKYVNIVSFEFIERGKTTEKLPETGKLSIYEAAELTVKMMTCGVIDKKEPLGQKVIELCSEAIGAINDLKVKAKENLDRMVQNLKEPVNIQNLLTWCQSHGKEYNRSWLLEKYPDVDFTTPEGVKKVFDELCEKMGWR